MLIQMWRYYALPYFHVKGVFWADQKSLSNDMQLETLRMPNCKVFSTAWSLLTNWWTNSNWNSLKTTFYWLLLTFRLRLEPSSERSQTV